MTSTTISDGISGFSMEIGLYFLSNNVIKNGSDREAFAAFDDEPTVGKKPEPKPIKKAVVAKPPEKEKKGFSWGKLFKAAVAVVAVVAVVALVSCIGGYIRCRSCNRSCANRSCSWSSM
ncbi:hypothetical protein KPL47_24515 [Clostridium estertheticum]|uniref:hypothetical protein n=1 Tax=Clostridium estertheticum TaxID=238834 RepID=UPI001C0D43ED|nr:hypothetical protein [Clostridium estertheticum]MBU3179437.1 hypothetical protein [Clostridium estertheticum]